MLSPAQFERQQILKAEGVQKSRGYSINCSGVYLFHAFQSSFQAQNSRNPNSQNEPFFWGKATGNDPISVALPK